MTTSYKPIALTFDENSKPTTGLRKFVKVVLSGKPLPNSFVYLLDLTQTDTVNLLKEVQAGIRFHAFQSFQWNLGISQASLEYLVLIPPRTLNRRKHEGRLRADESDRLIRVSRLFGRAIELFDGDVKAARQWLATRQRILGGAIPLNLARTEFGSREVEFAIGRIEHGVFA